MKKYFKFFGIFFGLALVFASSSSAQIQNKIDSKINANYPIIELGSCKDQTDCAKFCNISTNMIACVNYAEKNNLLSGEDLRVSKAVAKRVAEGTTPGQCKSEAECTSFCAGKTENIKECVAFAEELKIIPENELAEAKKILKALKGGAQMPGSCKTKGDCESYCAISSHIDECLIFAETAEILPKKELEEAKKVASFLKEGKTPGKCQAKKECEDYCSKDANFNECIAFAETAGLVTKEDAEIAKKAGGVGPGGCKSKESCEEYCNKDENIDACTSFAIEKGLVSDEQKELMISGIDQMTKALESLPSEMRDQVESCLKSSIGEEKYNKILNKTVKPTKEIGGKIEACFGAIKKPEAGNMGGKDMPPSADEIQKMIPKDIPEGMQNQIQEQIKNQMKNGIPSGDDIPSGMGVPPTNSGMPSGGPVAAPSGDVSVDCSSFASIPDAKYCQMVPAGPARDACLKCKE